MPQDQINESVPPTLEIKVLLPDEVLGSIDELVVPITEVAVDGFGREMTVDNMAYRLINEPNLIIASEDGRIVGFQLQKVANIDSVNYVYYSRAIRSDYQGVGLGRSLVNAAIDAYNPDVIGARSQNPAAILSFIRAMQTRGILDVFPFVDASQREQFSIFTRSMAILAHAEDKTDFSSGICRGAYSNGRLGNYQIRQDNLGIVQIENYLEGNNFHRDEGDALFYFALLNKF